MSKSNTIVVFLLLALAIALAYANSLNARFVYDDYAFVYNNESIRTFSPLSKFLFSPEAFSQPVSYHVYRPLASFTFAVNYALNGLNPSGYHLVNLLFHALNAFLLFPASANWISAHTFICRSINIWDTSGPYRSGHVDIRPRQCAVLVLLSSRLLALYKGRHQCGNAARLSSGWSAGGVCFVTLVEGDGAASSSPSFRA